jgi:DinB superfamily
MGIPNRRSSGSAGYHRAMEATANEDLTAQEAEAWTVFRAAVDAIPGDRRSEPLLPDGWTVKDTLWHVAYWWDLGAETFERMSAGVAEPEELADTDEINAGALAESRAMSLQDVEAGVIRIRERLLRAWAPVSEDPAAAETFAGETIEHYDDHRPALEALALP